MGVGAKERGKALRGGGGEVVSKIPPADSIETKRGVKFRAGPVRRPQSLMMCYRFDGLLFILPGSGMFRAEVRSQGIPTIVRRSVQVLVPTAPASVGFKVEVLGELPGGSAHLLTVLPSPAPLSAVFRWTQTAGIRGSSVRGMGCLSRRLFVTECPDTLGCTRD